MLEAYPIDSASMQILPFLKLSFPFQAKSNTGRIPLRHHLCQRNCPVASDRFLGGSIRFSQEDQLKRA